MSLARLTISDLGPKALSPFEVTGEEELSNLYAFEVSCVVQDGVTLPASLVGRAATLTLALIGSAERHISGIVDHVWVGSPTVQRQRVLRVRIVPELSRLGRYRSSRVFGSESAVSVSDILEKEAQGTLRRSKFRIFDHEIRLREKKYPKRDFILQYEETDFSFISRLTEFWGIFYLFEHDISGKAKVIFVDANLATPQLSDNPVLKWRPWSPGEAEAQPDTITGFEMTQGSVPKAVTLTDYNYRLAHGALLQGNSAVASGVEGDWIEYGGMFRSLDEGAFLANVRAQELYCQAHQFIGRSAVPRLTPGRRFSLTQHPYLEWNQEYLVTAVRHKLHVPRPGVSGLSAGEDRAGYSNEFKALPVSTPFRPARRTPWPRISGVINAVVETSGGPNVADIDADGRYRVRLRLDSSGAAAGKASDWVRLMAPFGGASEGMHFPLHPGTEVLVAFVNGDPDRPIILGAVPNVSQPSVVKLQNNLDNIMHTRRGLRIVLGE